MVAPEIPRSTHQLRSGWLGSCFFSPSKMQGIKQHPSNWWVYTGCLKHQHTIPLELYLLVSRSSKETHESAGLSGMGTLIINVWDTKGSHESNEMQASVSRNKWNTILNSSGMSRSLEAPTYATLLHLLSQAQAFPAHYPKPMVSLDSRYHLCACLFDSKFFSKTLKEITENECTRWWFQPIWNILVKWDHFPR